MTDSILDKIIDSQHQSLRDDFNVEKILEELLNTLDERERQVLNLRYGFSEGKTRTLEDIGKNFDITRERVRQIESGAIDKIKESEIFTNHKKSLVEMIEELLEQVGGLMSENTLLKKLSNISGVDKAEAKINFILQKLLHDSFNLLKSNNIMLKTWSVNTMVVAKYEKILKQVEKILNELNDIIKFSDLHEKLNSHDSMANEENVPETIFENLLQISAVIERNPFGHWGLKSWSLISPKRMNDKIYLVLKNHGKPMHFTEIAEKINETNFDHKKAHPATVHNELILDNNRYVLIGRGIYALKEWGFKSGVVTDIITDIIKNEGPLTKDEIIEKVLKQRIVKKSTIVLMLTNKKLFKKLIDGRYDIADQA